MLFEVVQLVKQTGCLLIQHSMSDREQRRNAFLESLRGWLSDRATEALDALDRHSAEAALCEDAFRTIYSSLGECPIGKVDPLVAAWATLVGTASDLAQIKHAVSTTAPPFVAPNLVFLSSEALRIEAFGKAGLDPDSMVERYAYNLGGYLRMLGHSYGWFCGAKLVIPKEAEIPNYLLLDRSALFLAEAWNQLEDHWDKLRYFDGSSVVSERRSYAADEEQREINTLVFEHDWQYFLELEIARARLRRQVSEIMLHVVYSPETAERVHDPTTTHVRLFPKGLISTEEAISALVLDMCYGLQVGTDAGEYFGLTLAEWLRGYCILQFCCIRRIALTEIAEGLCYLDLDALVRLAERSGMARERMLRFVEQVTFQKNSRDLFDAPLLQSADGRYVLFPDIQALSAIPEVLTSRINSLLVQVERKGFGFEEEVRQEFAELGSEVKRIIYRNAEGKFECDAAVLWGTDLFLVECKAYTLPRQSGGDLFFFRMKQEQAAEQVRRIDRHLAGDPSILEKAFGHKVEVSRTTLCVLNMAPSGCRRVGP